jgi:hypothetical protein
MKDLAGREAARCVQDGCFDAYVFDKFQPSIGSYFLKGARWSLADERMEMVEGRKDPVKVASPVVGWREKLCQSLHILKNMTVSVNNLHTNTSTEPDIGSAILPQSTGDDERCIVEMSSRTTGDAGMIQKEVQEGHKSGIILGSRESVQRGSSMQ